MPHRQQYVDAYHAAMDRERELWGIVEDFKPGTPQHTGAMTIWLDAVRESTAASKALREAYGANSKPGDLA